MSFINPNKLKNEFIEFVTIGRPIDELYIDINNDTITTASYINICSTREQVKTYVNRISSWADFDSSSDESD